MFELLDKYIHSIAISYAVITLALFVWAFLELRRTKMPGAWLSVLMILQGVALLAWGIKGWLL